MQSFRGSIRLIQRHTSFTGSNTNSIQNGVIRSKFIAHSLDSMMNCLVRSIHFLATRSRVKSGFQIESWPSLNYYGRSSMVGLNQPAMLEPHFANRCMTTGGIPVESALQAPSAAFSDVTPRIKFKRLDKTARNIMQILDKEAVEEVKSKREIPDIKPGYIVQLKVEVPENKRRVSTLKGIVIARRNAGINTTFRLRRLVAGVGVESLFPLYSPNIKEIKVLDKKKVRRAKLYYLRDRMNPLKK